MSSAQSPKASYKGRWKSEKTGWLDGDSNRVFRGRDQVINTLNGTSSDAEISNTLEGGGLDPEGNPESAKDRMAKASPFGENSSNIRHEAVTSEQFNDDHAEDILKDEKGEKDLKYDEEGEIYNMSFHEFFNHPEAPDSKDNNIDRNNLNKHGPEMDLLTVHTVIYEDPSGEEHLVHWDPGLRTDAGRKKKYLNDEGKPSLKERRKNRGFDLYRDNSNYQLKKGLSEITDTLRGMKERLYSEANDLMEKNSRRDQELIEAFDEGSIEATVKKFKEYKHKLDVEGRDQGYSPEVREKVWKAERWRAMADAIETFAQTYDKGRGTSRPVKKKIKI